MFPLLAVLTLLLAQDPSPRVDAAGDPLPEGAVCRLGTRRYRTPGRVWSLNFLDDKRLLVGAGTTLLLWDVEKHERIRAFQGHRGVVGSIAILPDRAHALTGAGDGTMALWNLETGQRVRSFPGHTGRVWTVALTPDGATALSAGLDGTLGLWNVKSGERTRTLSGHKGAATCAAFVQDGSRIFSGGADGRLILWDAATGDRLKSVEAHRGEISGLAISPDGRTMATTSGRMIPGDEPEAAEGALALWSVEDGRRIRTLPFRCGVLWAAFTRDGAGVFAGLADRTAGLWEVESGTRLLAFEGLGDRFHPVAERNGLVAVGDGTSVSLFDANSGRRRFDVAGHGDGVGGVGFLPDGSPITAGADGWLAVWNIATGRRIRTIDTGALEYGSLALSPDGKRAVAGGWRVPTSLWDLETGECLRRFEGRSARGVAFGAGTIAAGLLSGRVALWDPESGSSRGEHPGSASGDVAISADGSRALIPSSPAVSLLDVATGKPVRRLEGHAKEITALAFSPEGAPAAGSSDGLVILWDRDGGKEIGRLAIGSPVRALAFGPRGLLAVGHSTGLSIWDAPAGRKLATYQGHSGSVTSVAIDPEGRRALSGSSDTTAIVWEIPR